MIEKNQSYEVLIEDLTLEGNGVCRIDNFAVFVPMTAVGDKVRIKIVKVLKNYGFGIIEKIISPSDDRVDVDCPVFKQCGGCSFRHISYEAELKLKEKAVKDAFSRLGGFDLPIDGILPSEKTEFYRNKAQYPLGVENGEVISGFYAKRSHRIVKCDNCKIQDERFSKIANWILEFVKDRQISVYDEKSGKGLLRHIYLRIADKTGEIMVCLVSSKKKVPFLKEFSEEIKNIFPDVKSVVLNVNPENTNVILGRDYEVLSGSETIKDVFLGNDFLIAPASFYQVNKSQAERLYEKAFEYAEFKGDETLLDLYCGIGSIGLSAYKKVKNLIGVEVVPQAIENAKKNAELNNAKNTEFICGDAKKAAKELLKKGLKPDVIIIDPPRQGCDKEVIESITEMAPEKVVMISCNPSTAARDAKLLCENGYKLIKYTAVDLFPRTSHVETVALLSRQINAHKMKLNSTPFEMIKSGGKTIELRLFDEKRQQVKVGDRILFTNIANGEILNTTVVKLHRFDSFNELYKTLPLLQCGYTMEDVDKATPSDMEQYYSVEEQKKYGVVGIELCQPKKNYR